MGPKIVREGKNKASQSKKSNNIAVSKEHYEYILKPNIKKIMQRNYAIKYRKPIEINQKASHRAVEA